MKKSYGWLIAIGVVIAIAIWMIGKYNTLVTEQEKTSTAWSQVENVYQRRADLIPNLVATVKGYAKHEEETLTAVMEARAKATSVTVDASNLSEEAIAEFQKNQGQLTSALGRLIAVSEAYPDLKANQNFLELQAQLEGTENRIAVERNAFNEQAKAYNIMIRRFPTNIVAAIFGFDAVPYFKAEEGSEKAPVVSFE